MNTIQAFRLLTRPIVPLTRNSSNLYHGKKLPSPSAAFKAKQEFYQLDNGIPVHLKGGPVDHALYALTLGLCVVGVGKVLHVIYLYSFPQKPAS